MGGQASSYLAASRIAPKKHSAFQKSKLQTQRTFFWYINFFNRMSLVECQVEALAADPGLPWHKVVSLFDKTPIFSFLGFIFGVYKNPVRKRKAIESYGNSETFNKLTGLIGSGGLSVTAAVEIASSVVKDHHIPHEALKAFSTLGSSGDHPQNYERDLFRWLSNCFGMRLQPYTIYLDLQVSVL